MGAPCDHSREGRIRKALTKLSILYSGALSRQQKSAWEPLCSSFLPQWPSSVLGLPAVLRKNRNPLSKGHKALIGIRRKLPLLEYYCRLYTCTYPFLHHYGERGLTHWFASSSYHQPALGVLSPLWGGGMALPCCPSSCHTALHSHTAPWWAHHGTSFFPVWKFTCYFYQYSSKSFKINESSDLQIFSLSKTSIKYLPVRNEKSQTIHPFDLLLLS